MEEQRVILENRNKMTVSQVVDVDAFDEETLWANLADGAVEVSGSGLHIEKLDLAEGVLVVTGSISSFAYIEGKKQKGSKRAYQSTAYHCLRDGRRRACGRTGLRCL